MAQTPVFRYRTLIRGYKPCRLVTGRLNRRKQALVAFDDGARLWIDHTKVAVPS